MRKANIVAFIKTDFLSPVVTFANTPFMFFAFFTYSSPSNVFFLIFLDSWVVCATLRKILVTLDEKPQRNNLSKLGTLEYECPQLWHSALCFQSDNSNLLLTRHFCGLLAFWQRKIAGNELQSFLGFSLCFHSEYNSESISIFR